MKRAAGKAGPRSRPTLTVLNQQTDQRINIRLLRRIARTLLRKVLGKKDFELGICLVSADEITRLNETFLRHRGPTDVITFDYREESDKALPCPALHGEIFICVEKAIQQAREFRVSWPGELTRYLVHGVLHLLGFKDLRGADRQRMKREEDRLLHELGREFDLEKLRFDS